MNDAAVLNVCALADADFMHIPAYGDVVPDIAVLPYFHITDHGGRGRDKGAVVDFGVDALIGKDKCAHAVLYIKRAVLRQPRLEHLFPVFRDGQKTLYDFRISAGI